MLPEPLATGDDVATEELLLEMAREGVENGGAEDADCRVTVSCDVWITVGVVWVDDTACDDNELSCAETVGETDEDVDDSENGTVIVAAVVMGMVDIADGVAVDEVKAVIGEELLHVLAGVGAVEADVVLLVPVILMDLVDCARLVLIVDDTDADPVAALVDDSGLVLVAVDAGVSKVVDKIEVDVQGELILIVVAAVVLVDDGELLSNTELLLVVAVDPEVVEVVGEVGEIMAEVEADVIVVPTGVPVVIAVMVVVAHMPEEQVDDVVGDTVDVMVLEVDKDVDDEVLVDEIDVDVVVLLDVVVVKLATMQGQLGL